MSSNNRRGSHEDAIFQDKSIGDIHVAPTVYGDIITHNLIDIS